MGTLKSLEDFKRDFGLANFEVQLQTKLKLDGYIVNDEFPWKETNR